MAQPEILMVTLEELVERLGTLEAISVSLETGIEGLRADIDAFIGGTPPPEPPPTPTPGPSTGSGLAFGSPVKVTGDLFERVMCWSQRQIAVDSFGNIYVICLQRRGERNNVVWMSTDQGRSWEDMGNVSQALGWNARAGAIAVDTNDRVHVTFYDSLTGKHTVWHRYLDDDGWHPRLENRPTNVSQNGFSANEHPAIACDPNDEDVLLISWDGGRYAFSVNGGDTWTGTRNIGENLSRTMPLVLKNEDWFILGNSSIPKALTVYRSTAGPSWDRVARLDERANIAGYGSFYADSRDNIHLVYMADSGGSSKPQVRYSMWDGSQFSGPRTLAPSSRFQCFPAVGVDAQDTIHVAYHELSSWPGGYPDQSPGSATFDSGEIWYTSLPLGDIQTAPVRISGGGSNQFPTIACSLDGQVYVTYGRNRSPGDCMVVRGMRG